MAGISKQTYERNLQEVRRLLQRRYTTAALVQALMGCSKPIAYKRLDVVVRAAKASGADVRNVKIRVGKHGPKSDAWKIVSATKRKKLTGRAVAS